MKRFAPLLLLPLVAFAESSLDKRPPSASQTTRLSQDPPVRPTGYQFTDQDGFQTYLKERLLIPRSIRSSGGSIHGRTDEKVEIQAAREWAQMPYDKRYPYAVREKQEGTKSVAASGSPSSAELTALKTEIDALESQVTALSAIADRPGVAQRFASVQEILAAKKKLYKLKQQQAARASQ